MREIANSTALTHLAEYEHDDIELAGDDPEVQKVITGAIAILRESDAARLKKLEDTWALPAAGGSLPSPSEEVTAGSLSPNSRGTIVETTSPNPFARIVGARGFAIGAVAIFGMAIRHRY